MMRLPYRPFFHDVRKQSTLGDTFEPVLQLLVVPGAV